MTSNAIEHGVDNEKEKLKIVLDVTISYCIITVINPRMPFHPLDVIKSKKLSPDKVRMDSRGCGLLIADSMSDEIYEIESNRGIKCILYSDQFRCDVHQVRKCVIVNVVEGIFNPSIKKRLFHIILHRAKPKYLVIILESMRSRIRTALHELIEECNKMNIKVVVLSEYLSHILPPDNVADTLRNALDILGYREDYTKFKEAILRQIEEVKHQYSDGQIERRRTIIADFLSDK